MTTISYWLDEPAEPRQTVEMDGPADVAVVGGGITGCSCALALAEAGLRVRLIEPFGGWEPRSASTGSSGSTRHDRSGSGDEPVLRKAELVRRPPPAAAPRSWLLDDSGHGRMRCHGRCRPSAAHAGAARPPRARSDSPAHRRHHRFGPARRQPQTAPPIRARCLQAQAEAEARLHRTGASAPAAQDLSSACLGSPRPPPAAAPRSAGSSRVRDHRRDPPRRTFPPFGGPAG